MKKVGNTRPFRHDLNQIPYDYTVEVRNRFKGLDLIDRVPDELWTEVYDIVQETGIKTIPKEKKCVSRPEALPLDGCPQDQGCSLFASGLEQGLSAIPLSFKFCFSLLTTKIICAIVDN